MTIHNKKEPVLLFLGDFLFFAVSLWIALYLRYFRLPDTSLVHNHLLPFTILFLVWALVFFIAGLYDKQTVILKSRLPAIIFQTQVFNSILAVLFFYFIPYFGITPKTNLFIDLIVSFILILGWRLYVYPWIGIRKKQNAILIGSGKEIQELRDEVNANSAYSLCFVSSIDLAKVDEIDFQEDILRIVYQENISVIVIDLHNPKADPLLPHLYNLIFSNIVFIDKHRIYEDIFNRIPLSLVKYNWFLENISSRSNVGYDTLKRLMDIVAGFVLGIISIIFYPFVYLAIKINDGGPIFIAQERVGQNNVPFKIYKFRSMSRNELDLNSEANNENHVTTVGNFLRKTRIDELPQLWSVVRGDMSLIGPRPELLSGVRHYEKEIPYYAIRHLLKPGLSGWAQLYHDNHPHHGIGVDQTKEKLSYDLYYIKNRSFILDIKIALKTIKKLVSRSGI